jgi:hypothetical protein
MNSKLREYYLNIIENLILSKLDKFNYSPLNYNNNIFKNLIKFFLKLIISKKNQIVIKSKLNDYEIENGLVRSTNSFSMVGTKRLRNIKFLLEELFKNNIDGDLIEAGIWKGGVLIYMRACLLAYGVDKKVYGADSFEGLPPIDDINYPSDKIYRKILKKGNDKGLIVTENEVIDNLDKFGFNDKNTILLKGWFDQTLKDERIKKICLLRIDGDMYKSTYEALNLLYKKVVKGGYIIVDDYGLKSGSCKQAVDDFRLKQNITSDLINIDWSGVFWKKNDS